MVKVAIVEDEATVAGTLTGFLNRYAGENDKAVEVVHFNNAAVFLEKYENVYDFVLMDIEMPYLDGMSAVKRLRGIDKKVLVVFVTNLAQYAVNGYEVDAFDFIVKPVSYYNFALKLDRVFQRLSTGRERELWVATRRGKKMVAASTLKYVEVMKHVLIYHTTDGDVTGSGTLKGVLELLEGLPFALCNQCYLVNLHYVSEVIDYKVVVDGEMLQISAPRRKAFLRALNNFLGSVKT